MITTDIKNRLCNLILSLYNKDKIIKTLLTNIICVAVLSVAIPLYSNAIDMYALEQKVTVKTAELTQLIDEAKQRGIDTSYDEVTLTTADIFKQWALWDASHQAELKKAVSETWFLRKQCDVYCAKLPQKELSDTIEILDKAILELNRVINNPQSRRATIPFNHAKVVLKDGCLYIGDQPVFTSALTWGPVSARSLTPGMLREEQLSQ
ncbi:MAG: hypothetical protein PF904_02140 [Kiritimatiellae bacterium]|jgi:hypothetical protein|nr:hypothetical protein [Kiritimatiellia bacterium]